MTDVVYELLVTEIAARKLARRGISEAEARQLLSNVNTTVRNASSQRLDRRMLIGLTDGGKVVTLVIEETLDPTTWLTVTGWIASSAERKMLFND